MTDRDAADAADTRAGVRLIFAGEGMNAGPYLGEGWHGPEDTHRWTDGFSSVVRLPPMRPSAQFALTLQCWPLRVGGITQRVTVEWNGSVLLDCQPNLNVPAAVIVPGDLVNAHAENVLTLHHPDARSPAELESGNGDNRTLALGFTRLDLAPLDITPFATPHFLPRVAAPADKGEARAVVEVFQSLGQNCDLGLFQRNYGTDPFGLLRFASIFPDRLVDGLRRRFAGIGIEEKLSFKAPKPGGELIGRHAEYGLDYHTFKNEGEVSVETFTTTEARRLNYLARLFIEQLENNEKIFLRVEHFELQEEALALHLLLQSYNSRNRLILLQAAPESAPELIGRVMRVRPGLYRGYLSSISDETRERPRPLFEEWLTLCATVVAFDRSLS